MYVTAARTLAHVWPRIERIFATRLDSQRGFPIAPSRNKTYHQFARDIESWDDGIPSPSLPQHERVIRFNQPHTAIRQYRSNEHATVPAPAAPASTLSAAKPAPAPRASSTASGGGDDVEMPPAAEQPAVVHPLALDGSAAANPRMQTDSKPLAADDNDVDMPPADVGGTGATPMADGEDDAAELATQSGEMS